MVRRKCVRGRAIWQPLLVVFISVVILFTSLIGTGATTRVNRDFLDAAFNGDTKAVEALLAEGADVNVKDGIGFTALFGAARSGYTEIVKLLLANGADPNVKLPTSGTTALMYAVYGGRNQVVIVLLAKGAEINAKDNEGLTALEYAETTRHE
ncbi:MAG: ankyrin repeat domain-containing protein [Syntrophobacterales bacterium]|jgi:ankyrin repeat protein